MAPQSALHLVDRDQLDPRHSIYLIVHQLHELGLGVWAPKVMDFLRRYDGLEPLMDPREMEPVVFARQLMFDEVLHARREDDREAIRQRLARALADAPFTGYGAAFKLQDHRPGARQVVTWRPLQQTWLDFLEQGPVEGEGYWLDIFCPSPLRAPTAEIVRFLLA